jgi:tetratricopeptide (TPR) repeat protein
MVAAVPFDDPWVARTALRAILGRYVDHLLRRDIPGQQGSLSPAAHSDTLVSLLNRCHSVGDGENYTRLLARFAPSLERTIPLYQLDDHLAIALSFDMLTPEQFITFASTRLRILTQQGERETAMALLDSSWPVADGFPGLLAELCIRQGVLAVSFGDYEGGREVYERGLVLARSHGDTARQSILLNNLGNLLYSIDQYEDARDAFQKALEVAEHVDDPVHRARAAGGLALTLDELGRSGEAELYYQKAKEAAHEAGDLFSVLSIELNLCYHSLLQEAFEVATMRAASALKLARQLGDRDREAHALHNLGHACLGTGDYEAAWVHLSRALEWRIFIGKRLYVETTLDMIARLARHVEEATGIDADLRAILLRNCQGVLEAARHAQPPDQDVE